jgi:hypothetical protein
LLGYWVTNSSIGVTELCLNKGVCVCRYSNRWRWYYEATMNVAVDKDSEISDISAVTKGIVIQIGSNWQPAISSVHTT